MIKTLQANCKELTLLYVEDDKELSNSTKELFENFFKLVDVAYDGQEGLSLYNYQLDTNGVAYDLVITDINMPHMNGIEMSKAILKRAHDQSIIIISAHNESEYLFEAIDFGISSFISKPVSLERLTHVLYKVTLAITDHKLSESYLASLETLTIQLDKQNQELIAKNAQLEKASRLLNTVSKKEEIQSLTKKTVSTAQDQNENRLKEQIDDFIKDELAELKDLINEIDIIIIGNLNNLQSITQNSIAQLASYLKKYALTLSVYPFFSELSHAIADFADTLINSPIPENQERVKNCFLLLEAFVYDLTRWHEDLSSGDSSRFNLIDASNIQNMHQIAIIWQEDDNLQVNEAELDDIFDF